MEVCKKKILVTGASGFIGSALSNKLLKLGATVYAVSRRDYKTDNGIIWYKGDLSDLSFVEFLIKEIQPDVDLTFFPNESSSRINIPIGVSFFWPDI